MDSSPASQDDTARLEQLAQLEAFGQEFMSSFTTQSPQLEAQDAKGIKTQHKKRKRQEPIETVDDGQAAPPEEINALFGASSSKSAMMKASDSEAKPRKSKQSAVQTVVFSGGEADRVAEEKAAKRGWKSFMSSKIDKIGKEDESGKDAITAHVDEEEKELKANDRLLSDLLSTTLFAPGSGNSKGKQKLSSSDTIARVLELSSSETQRKGQALGRGWGEKELKRQQLSKAPAAIRQGMRKAAGERKDKEREKAKELGTWHPSLKQAYSGQATATERGTKKDTSKRQRGMGVGIGKFQGGILTLSASDISKVNGHSKKTASRGKGKGKPRPNK